MVMRYRAWAQLAGFWALLFAFAQPASGAERPGHLEFEVIRNGEHFGRQGVTVTQSANGLVAESSADLRAALGPIVLFNYTQRCNETWQDRALVGLRCVTRRNGRLQRVDAAVLGNALRVTSGGRAASFAAATLPTSWWTRPPLDISEMINSETGARLPVRVTLVGRETINVGGRQIAADHIRVSGTVPVDLWYDARGHWVNCAFTLSGQHMTYRLLTPLEQAPS